MLCVDTMRMHMVRALHQLHGISSSPATLFANERLGLKHDVRNERGRDKRFPCIDLKSKQARRAASIYGNEKSILVFANALPAVKNLNYIFV